MRYLPSRDRLSVLIAVIVLAYTLSRFLNLPALAVDTTLLGSALGLELSGPFVIQLLVAALISTGADALIRAHPRFAAPDGPHTTLAHWIVPGAAALVLGAGLERLPDGPAWWLGLAAVAVSLTAVLLAEFTVVAPEDPGHDTAALALNALTYGLALVLFAVLHNIGARAAIAATIAGGVAAALAWRLFTLNGARAGRAAFYALITGLVCAEALWAVLYWRMTTGGAAALLLLVFYILVGLASQILAGRFTRRAGLEYGLMALAAGGLIVFLRP